MTGYDAHAHDNSSPDPPLKQAVSDTPEAVDFDEKFEIKTSIQEDTQHAVAMSVNQLEQHVNDMDDSWETESLLADLLDDLSDEKDHDGKCLSFVSCVSSFHLPRLAV